MSIYRLFVNLLLLSFLLFFITPSARATYDPLSVPNNRVGVHILDPNEIAEAAKLVNSNGGEWGFVTIPIRSNDRDREKWLTFFENCRKLRVIPIIRLATFVYGPDWVAPNAYDLVDFANFLSDMPWPTKNRFVILFNEPNHSKEWGGRVSPHEYATLILDAHQIFKSRSSDYFLLSAGLDMSAPNNHTSLDALDFYRQMTRSQPGWYKSVDGLSVHAYPNPGFSASVYSKTRYGPRSFDYELKTLKSLGLTTPKPLFITETGTVHDSNFYTPAFTEVWKDQNIVAITPFLLFAGSGDFVDFSLLDKNHKPKNSYKSIENLKKTAGSPLLSNLVIVAHKSTTQASTPVPQKKDNFIDSVRSFFSKKTPTLSVGNATITVEISDTKEKTIRGLSGRDPLPESHGMLFIFTKPQVQQFWMYQMKFALDFVWIRDGKVVSLDENIPPPALTNNQPQVVSSKVEIDQVLEVSAGFIKKHGIKVGDSVVLSR